MPLPPSDDDVAILVDVLHRAQRVVFVAGRGARGAGSRTALEGLAEATGALLATSAVAKGLFNGNPWSLDVSGGFSSPLAAELISSADLIVGWGCALNMWTMRHGRLIADGATVIQVDDDPHAIGAQREGVVGVVGDVRETALAVAPRAGGLRTGYRTDELKAGLASEVRRRDVPFTDESTVDRIDARTLTIALDDLLPADRVVSVDSGNCLRRLPEHVPVGAGRVGVRPHAGLPVDRALVLATAIGAAALAEPHRPSGRRPRRWRRAHGGRRARHRRPPRAADGRDRVQRLATPTAPRSTTSARTGSASTPSSSRRPILPRSPRGFGFEAVTVRTWSISRRLPGGSR